ncbi:MAG: hydrogenase 4 subunit B [Alphaproteobacteria bacterium]|nr:hydrogenase 4 subunit B [Alphaproteobacteria bacterium]
MMLVALLLCVAGLFAVAVAATILAANVPGRVLTYGATAALTLVALSLSALGLFGGGIETLRLPIGLPWLGANFRLDALAAFFLVVVNLGAAASSIFALGYGRHETAPQRVLPFFPAFIAAMNLVVLADDAFSFLFAWEFMSLTSWALVLSHDRDATNRRAGFIYIVMAGFGTLALLLAFGVLAGTDGNYAFAAMRAHAPDLQTAALVLFLVLLGAGSKAGIVPLHVWLPLAHPAAPSHVSALMSGVMTKVAVYAFARVAFDLANLSDWRLSAVVIALGGVTAVLGVLYALMEHDLKRLLAYHTVENIGIIFVGLGLALAFRANGLHAAAALAATAALFHVFNHSLFKSLLFFGSGAVLGATRERDMERLGGLIHRMPKTAAYFLIGAAAISALPPLNGFASEWLTFQAIFLSPHFPQWGLRFLAPAAGAMLALAAALAAACFVKAFGITFLGRARSPQAETGRETDKISLAAMAGLAALCIVAGAVPGTFTAALAPVSQMIASDHMPSRGLAAPWSPLVPSLGSANSYNGLVLLALLAAAIALVMLALRILANGTSRRAPAWDCGFPDPSPATQYGAESFAQPIRRVFGTIAFRAREEVFMPQPGDTAAARIHVRLIDPVWEAIFAPIARGVGFVADTMNPLQFLTIRRYLMLVFLSLVVLLAVLALWL